MLIERCGPLAAWYAAWLAGSASVDEVIDAAGGGATADGAPLLSTLLDLRSAGGAVRVVFPAPGDVRGLPGPTAFRARALDRHEAVVGAGLGLTCDLVEHAVSSRPAVLVWTVQAIDPVPNDPVSVLTAQHELTDAIRETAGALAAAQVAGSSGAAPDLAAVRRAGETPNLPRDFPPRAVALVAQAQRLQAVLDLALLDPVGGAVDRTGMAARDTALRPLAAAVRRARTAGYNALTETG